MEAAAATIRQLSRQTLPDRPHQLSTSLDYRAPYFPEDSRAHGFEEQRIRHCQYMTLVSHGDRGILMPRSYHEFREEPPKPVVKEISTLARPGGSKKTLSLSDYQNKKASANSSPHSTPKPDRLPGPRMDAKPSDSVRRPETMKPVPHVSSVEGLGKAKPKGLPEKIEVDMSLPPKPPPPLHPKSILHDRKRPADLDEARPPKRPKPTTNESSREDIRQPTDTRTPVSSEDPIRRKPVESAPSRDQAQRERSSSLLGIGRSAMVNALPGANRPESPAARPRTTSINGVKSSSAEKGHNGAGTSSGLGEAKPKIVPPLLSPLRVGVEPEQSKPEKRRRDDGPDSRTERPPKPEPRPAAKRLKPPPRIPSLLSPTLPAAVEEALERRQQVSKGKTDAISTETKAKDRDGAIQSKAPAETCTDKSGRARKSLIVRLKVPSKLRDRFAKVLQSSVARKGVAKPVRPSEKYPASSLDPEPPSPAAKRPRTSDMSFKHPEPSTPSKKSTTMSRVSSSNSLAPTPADLVATPSLPDGAERSSDVNKSKTQALKAKEVEYQKIGRTIKHKADPMLRPGNDSSTVNGSVSKQERMHKRAFALMLESICAFMLSFQVQDQLAALNHKPCDGTGWQSCLPLIEVIQHHIRRGSSRRSLGPVYAISLLLQAVATEKLTESYTTRDEKSVDMARLFQHTRSQFKIRANYRDVVASIENPSLRIRESHMWPQVDDAVEATLRVLRAWCAEENVDWTAELSLTGSTTAKANTT
ncbi:uncharacterized protein F5Z01DRAFT_692972 [Emericellopsis atlantica]|uniref:Uncharacterized protein n=1 Tax=Emericellopsis atlantica TaxID=2614577 RepID=A0A9P8CV88_9HYPO|nr:uncharacterized protein F5Z01DRAFT_692972 [Emericellopsis atlantica]KAG9258046.1 hypothetical protein F5Z01DRAFT_692972 [Emericellopsis atlantica]